ncbi:ribosome production factor 2 homolog [Tetranychus urticae]|uniref:Ribosome production factor 2 homolog n=1 Tax=Tetranychus urticae TaxID=32264 RepID=T1K4R2_TETUR|nr:ribosome production factor 2 homolog [Tetranychus urticae]
MDKVIKPKTARGKRKLLQREPKVIEGPKNCVFLRSSTINQFTTDVMKDICTLKKPFTVFRNKHGNKLILPFEDVSPVEFLCKKYECPLFVVGSHSKKRANNIVMGRTFDNQVLDMFELGIENYKPMAEFKIPKIAIGSKPLLIFGGEQFDEQEEFKRFRNFLIDFFVGCKLDGLRLSGVEHVIQVVAHESKILFRCYKVRLSPTGTKYSKLELEEMGPRIDFSLRRSKLASDDLLKKSLKKPAEVRIKKVKNIKKSKLGTTFGRIHMTRQDYSGLQTRKMKGLKKTAATS